MLGRETSSRADRYLRVENCASVHGLHPGETSCPPFSYHEVHRCEDNAETAVKDLLRSVVKSLPEKNHQQKATLHAVDYMDDGSKICLRVDIDGQEVGESLRLHCRSTSEIQ